MKRIQIALVLFFLCAAVGFGQTSAQWQVEEKKDAFTDAQYTQYRLEGKYLEAPSDDSATPSIVLRCKPGPNGGSGRKFDGKLLSAFLYVGQTVVDAHWSGGTSTVTVQYRFDDGKIHTNYLYHSTNYKAISLQPPMCGFCVIDDFFYSHEMPHKEDTTPQNKKIVVRIPEFVGGNVVIQFDLPDVTEVAKACGVTYHK